MSHYPRPFFKKARGLWYVEINRKQINLGPDREEAFRQYHQLMARPRETADLRNRRVGDSNPRGVMPACDTLHLATGQPIAPEISLIYRQHLAHNSELAFRV